MLLQAKCSIRKPPEIGPMAMPMPATAAQMAIAFGRSCAGKMLVRIESVVGMIPAAPRPISAREAISWSRSVDRAASDRSGPEDDEAGHERAPAAEAVAEAAGGEQQPGEDQQVAVHDPLQLARARVELARGSSADATLRIVLPMVMTSRLSERTTSASQRRAYGGLVVDICMLLAGGGGSGWTRD